MKRFAAQLGASTPPPPIQAALTQWAARYRGFAQRRFDKFSKGGGDWPPLTLGTIRARRSGKGAKSRSSLARIAVKKNGRVVGHRLGAATRRKGNQLVNVTVSLLRDKGLLFAALNPTFGAAPGAVEQKRGLSVLVGYGGPARHGVGGSATIADIASFHDVGSGHLPKRQIIVPPDASVLSSMANDMQRALGRLGQDEIG